MIYNMAGGKKLPELTNPATAADLLEGKQLIDADGNIVTGTIESSYGRTIRPGEYEKTAISAGQYAPEDILIEGGGSDFTASSILKGRTIFGIKGSAKDYGTMNDPTRNGPTVIPPEVCEVTNYSISHSGNGATVNFTIKITLPSAYGTFKSIFSTVINLYYNAFKGFVITLSSDDSNGLKTGDVGQYLYSGKAHLIYSGPSGLYCDEFPGQKPCHIEITDSVLTITVSDFGMYDSNGGFQNTLPPNGVDLIVRVESILGIFY